MFLAALQAAVSPSPAADPSGIVYAVSFITILGVLVNAAVHLRSSGKIEGAIVQRLNGIDQDIDELKESRKTMWEKINDAQGDIKVLQATSNLKGKTIHG